MDRKLTSTPTTKITFVDDEAVVLFVHARGAEGRKAEILHYDQLELWTNGGGSGVARSQRGEGARDCTIPEWRETLRATRAVTAGVSIVHSWRTCHISKWRYAGACTMHPRESQPQPASLHTGWVGKRHIEALGFRARVLGWSRSPCWAKCTWEVWRRVAHSPRFEAACVHDRTIRERLHDPSIGCLRRQGRLLASIAAGAETAVFGLVVTCVRPST